MTKEWYSIANLVDMRLPGLPGTARGIAKKAKREAWQSRHRQAVGGGDEYHLSALPPDAQLALLALESAPILAETPPIPPKTRELAPVENPAAVAAARAEGDAKAAQLIGKARARMEARLEILREFERYCAENPIKGSRKSGGTLQKESFAVAWNRGEIVADARARFPVISAEKLERWADQLRRNGLYRLAGKYGHRKGCGLIDAHPQLGSALRGLLLEMPHVNPSKAAEWLSVRYESGVDSMPTPRTVGRWLSAWKREHAELYARMRDPDDWKNRYMIGWGDASAAVLRLNQVWEFDSTPADVILKDGRHSILGVIDIYSRRVRLHVSKTSRATAVASLLRGALLDWGVPEVAKTDNGQEYVSRHVQRIFQSLGIEQRLSAPFSPWQKPFIERFFRTFSHDLIEFLPGYAGHNVAEREAIRARQQFSDRLFVKNCAIELSLDAAELQTFCDRWVAGYHDRPHAGIDGERPLERLANWRQPIRTVANERALDLLLSEAPGDGWRGVTKSGGIRLDKHDYIAPELGAFIGQRVRVLYDPEGEMGRIYCFDGKGEFIAVAECPELTGLDRREVAARAKTLQRERVNAGMKELRQEAKEIGVKAAAADILDARESAASKVAIFPKRTEGHASAGLAGAERALESDRPSEARVVAPERLEALREQMAREEEARRRIAERPDFRSPFHRVQWVFENVLAGRVAVTQVPADDRAFVRAYLRGTADHRALDYLGDLYVRYAETKADFMREEETPGADAKSAG